MLKIGAEEVAALTKDWKNFKIQKDLECIQYTVENEDKEEFPKIPQVSARFRTRDDIVPKQIIRFSIPEAFKKQYSKYLDIFQELNHVGYKSDAWSFGKYYLFFCFNIDRSVNI